MKNIFLFFLSLIFVVCLLGCDGGIINVNNSSYDDLVWNNNEAIYVIINDIYADEIFRKIDKSFDKYQFKKAYVVNKYKNNNKIYYLNILFIIDGDINEFVMTLKEDKRIKSYEICRDIPFESIDNRYFEYDNNIITIGDEMKITLTGTSDIYHQQFSHDSFYVVPKNYDKNKEYDLSFFGKNNNISYIGNVGDGLLITINNSNYHELIKTMDKLSRSRKIESIDFNYIYVIPPIWEISNQELVDAIINDENSITITALNPGIVNIKYDGIECTITINN